MQKRDSDSISRGGLAALAVLVVSLSLGGCATAPSPQTQLSWPVGTTYTVRSGDTLSEIAEDYSLTEDALVRYNGIDNRNRIFVGQVLRIPRDSNVVRSASRSGPSRRVTVARATPLPRPERGKDRRRATPMPDTQPVEPAQAYAAPLQFIWPVAGPVISPFGATATGGRNDGINIAARLGEPIRAAASGTVTYAGNELKGYGNLVLLHHDDGYVTAYAHAERLTVARGDHVSKGQVIGYAGATGDVTSPQLHFEIRHGVQPVDPKLLLLASNGV